MIGRPPPVGRTARVEKQHPPFYVANGLVAVTVDQAIEMLAGEFFKNAILNPIGRSPAMDEADAKPSNGNYFFQGDRARWRVHIPPDGMDSSGAEEPKDIGVDHVACVKNQLDIVKIAFDQPRKNLKPTRKIYMGIGNHSNFNHSIPKIPRATLADIIPVS